MEFGVDAYRSRYRRVSPSPQDETAIFVRASPEHSTESDVGHLQQEVRNSLADTKPP